LFEPEGYGSGECDGGEDASPALEAAEHDLDALALLVEFVVVRDWHLAAFGRRDAGRDAFGQKGVAEGRQPVPHPAAQVHRVGVRL
jgi:hypothetical protein